MFLFSNRLLGNYINRASICRHTQVVGLVLAILGVCYGCCAPKKFGGPVRVQFTTVAHRMPNITLKIYETVYDAQLKRAAIGYREADNSTIYFRNILDYGKGVEYLVTSDWSSPNPTKCSKFPLQGRWRRGTCIPANSTKSDGFYMNNPSYQMDAFAFTHTQGSMTAKILVTQEECALVGEVIYDTSNPAFTNVISRLYVNQSMFSSNAFFELPPQVTCVPQPNPRQMTPWQRIGMFGWLLERPDI